MYDGFGFTRRKLESWEPEVPAMNECEYPSFPQPLTDRGRAQAPAASIGNLVDQKSRVKLEDLLAIRELSDMHAFIDCKDSGVQAG